MSGYLLLAILAVIVHLFFGIVTGLALVRVSANDDGFWPEKRMKKIALFAAGFVFWPLVFVWLGCRVYAELTGPRA